MPCTVTTLAGASFRCHEDTLAKGKEGLRFRYRLASFIMALTSLRIVSFGQVHVGNIIASCIMGNN